MNRMTLVLVVAVGLVGVMSFAALAEAAGPPAQAKPTLQMPQAPQQNLATAAKAKQQLYFRVSFWEWSWRGTYWMKQGAGTQDYGSEAAAWRAISNWYYQAPRYHGWNGPYKIYK